jgi:hypothetical protein
MVPAQRGPVELSKPSYPLHEVPALLGIKPRRLNRLIANGTIRVRITRAELRRLLEDI